MKFLIDAQLPPVLGRVFAGTGHDCEHVEQVGLLRAEDRQIWDYALRNGSIILSKDEDFPKLKAFDPSGPAVVWLRVGNCSNQALLRWFQPLLADVVDRLQKGEGLIEVV
jgi:predicted nuclease of predicted toxin-antitoxin system